MTQLTPAQLATEISSLLADNTSGNITASDVRTIATDTKDSTFFLNTNTFGDILSGAVACSTIAASGDVTIANGKAIQPDTTNAHTLLIKAYYTTGTAYETLATITNGAAPALSIAASAHGTVAIDGASIGAVTPGSGAFTTLAASGNVAVATNKFTVAAATGNTLIAGTLALTSDLAINTNKFTVTASSGNTLIAGTLALTSDLAINTNKFTVTASSGNTLVAGTLNVTGVTTLSTYLLKDVGNALTAAGTTRADALALTKSINNVTTAGANTGVILPASQVGMDIIIFNAGANAIKVYGAGSDTIDTVAGSTGVTLTNAKRCRYICVAANTWISGQLGVISA